MIMGELAQGRTSGQRGRNSSRDSPIRYETKDRAQKGGDSRWRRWSKDSSELLLGSTPAHKHRRVGREDEGDGQRSARLPSLSLATETHLDDLLVAHAQAVNTRDQK